jgi:death-on-curing protein
VIPEPGWIEARAVILLHAESLAEHGGPEGLRDEGLLESALGRPRNISAYQPKADIAALAAGYGWGIAHDHPFVDGNKRAAFLAVGLFLRLNGFRLVADKADATRTMMGVAAGEIDEAVFGDWIRAHIAAVAAS